jgi:hypothetical protein
VLVCIGSPTSTSNALETGADESLSNPHHAGLPAGAQQVEGDGARSRPLLGLRITTASCRGAYGI